MIEILSTEFVSDEVRLVEEELGVNGLLGIGDERDVDRVNRLRDGETGAAGVDVEDISPKLINSIVGFGETARDNFKVAASDKVEVVEVSKDGSEVAREDSLVICRRSVAVTSLVRVYEVGCHVSSEAVSCNCVDAS